jgi:eukaryotic-like serine/threonine-protein kinase
MWRWRDDAPLHRAPRYPGRPMTTDPAIDRSLLGTVLASRYELRARIGRGGMGEVYEAVDRRLDRTVAVKVLRAELAADRRFPTRFRREARTVAGLSHPGIVSVHDFGEDSGRTFIVMELLAGRTLGELSRIEAPMDAGRVARIGVGAAQALAHAHTRGVVHRDISPGNVMVTPRGEVKVLDFGIARAARGSSRPGSGTTHGTIAYVAPERLRGAPVDHRADIYSLGAVLYELATGRPPTVEGTIPAADVRPDLPRRLSAALDRCLATDTDSRFADAGSLAEELWKVAMVEPATRLSAPALALTDPARTAPLSRTRTEVLPAVSARRGPGRTMAGLAAAVVAIAAAFVAVPTLASMLATVDPTVKGPRPVPVPTGLVASASCDGWLSTGVELEWSAGGLVTGYEIWRTGALEPKRTLVARIDADRTSYRDIDLPVGASYTYTVRATDGPRLSRRSNPADTSTPLLCFT